MTAKISEEHISIMRSQLVGNVDEYTERLDRLPAGESQWLFGILLAAALYKAANERFAETGTMADVITYVGNVRSRSDRVAATIDARVAERMLVASLGNDDISDITPEQAAKTRAVLLAALVGDKAHNQGELDSFLDGARLLADQWVAASGRSV